MRLSTRLSPACSAQVQIGHQPRLGLEQLEQVRIDLGRVDRRQAQARQVGDQLEDAAHQLAQGRLAGQVRAPGGDVDAGQHHLVIALGRQAADLLDHLAGRGRARVSPAIGDDAEGAAVIAAVLDLDIGPGAVLEAGDQVTGGLLDRHDVVDPHAGGGVEQGARRGLLGVAQHQVHLRHGGEGGGVDLGGAAGDDQPGVRPLAAGLADRLTRLAHGLVGHRAGVEHHRVGRPSALARARMASDS
jgi:hypothetical protein